MVSVAVDLGGTKVAVGCVEPRTDAFESSIRTRRWELDATPDEDLRLVVRLVHQAAAGRHGGVVDALTIAFPGALDDRGVVTRWPTRSTWEGLDLVAAIESATGCAPRVHDDALLAGYAEACAGEHRGGMLYLGVGTGVGGSWLPPGNCAATVSAAGPETLTALEAGHLPLSPAASRRAACACGRNGCLQAVAAGPAFALSAKSAGPLEAAERSGRALAHAIVLIGELMDFEVVLLGGSVGVRREVTASTRRALRPWARTGAQLPEIRPATYGAMASLAGATLTLAPPAHDLTRRTTIRSIGMTAVPEESQAVPTIGRDELPPWPVHDQSERTALGRVLDQGQWWRVGGSEVETFEQEFATYTGARHALTVNSGTAALEIALRVHEIGNGDEVIIPAFTFISTALAVQNVGAVPVPVDVDPGTLCQTVAATEAAITPRTRAIMPVHMSGTMSPMPDLLELAERHGLELIQDAAHAHGGVGGGRRVGEWPGIAAYSFQNGKLMTAGEGGALTFDRTEDYERAFLIHTCGRPRGDTNYKHETVGVNARMNEFSGAVLRSQLARYPGQLAVREERGAQLDELLADVPGLRLQRADSLTKRNPRYMYLLVLDGERFDDATRDAFRGVLERHGVPSFVAFPPVYRTRSFWQGATGSQTADDLRAQCPESEYAGDRAVWLPHRLLLARPDTITRVAEVVRAATAAVW